MKFDVLGSHLLPQNLPKSTNPQLLNHSLLERTQFIHLKCDRVPGSLSLWIHFTYYNIYLGKGVNL